MPDNPNELPGGFMIKICLVIMALFFVLYFFGIFHWLTIGLVAIILFVVRGFTGFRS